MQNIDKEELKKLIKSLKENGFIYNEADLCQKSDIPQSYLSDMKSGRRPVSDEMIQRIEKTFPEYFGGKKSETTENRTDIERFLSIIESDHQLFRDIISKKDEEINRLLSIMEADRGITKKEKTA